MKRREQGQAVIQLRIARQGWLVRLGLCSCLATLFIASPVLAEAKRAFQPSTNANALVRPNRRVERVVNLNQAIRIAQKESGGKVLSARTLRMPEGKLMHEVRVLVGGQKVTTLVINERGQLGRRRR